MPTASSSRTRLVQVFMLGLVAVTLVHLFAQLTAPDEALSQWTQILLMPLLAGIIFFTSVTPRNQQIKLVLVALFFSWLGDAIPRFLSGDSGFLTMVGCFLVAQVFYIWALAPFWRRSVLARPGLLIPYLIAFALLIVVCAPGAGALLIPVIIYGVALVAMAILSTGLGKVAGLGGGIFFCSDALIALRSFSQLEIPWFGFWIMLTYVLGQYLLTTRFVKSALDGPKSSTVGAV